jgi:hypothetical protein
MNETDSLHQLADQLNEAVLLQARRISLRDDASYDQLASLTGVVPAMVEEIRLSRTALLAATKRIEEMGRVVEAAKAIAGHESTWCLTEPACGLCSACNFNAAMQLLVPLNAEIKLAATPSEGES